MFLSQLVNNLSISINRYPDVLKYLDSRGMTPEYIREHQIGYAKIVSVPDDKSEERERFMKDMRKGRTLENHIIFPIHDMMGKIVGIHARSFGVKDFRNFIRKEAQFSGFFFGFFQALPHIYSSGLAYVCEGPFDHAALKKIYPNTVSALTAGLYESQYDLLMLFAKRIITIFDSDDPGRIAAEKASNRYDNVDSVCLGYKDPSECYSKLSLNKFVTFVKRKVSDIPPF